MTNVLALSCRLLFCASSSADAGQLEPALAQRIAAATATEFIPVDVS